MMQTASKLALPVITLMVLTLSPGIAPAGDGEAL